MAPSNLLSKIRAGVPAIILDDHREMEGDLFCPAEVITPDVVQFMIRQGSGVLCLALPEEELLRKGIPRISDGIRLLSILRNHFHEPHWVKFIQSMGSRGVDTPFHFPVDLRGQHSGVSVLDRFGTIQGLINPKTTIDDFDVPGHLATLGARHGGLQNRLGHTEAAVDLCRTAGLEPAGVLCELVGDYGEMRRGEELESFAEENSLPLIKMSDIVSIVSRALIGAR